MLIARGNIFTRRRDQDRFKFLNGPLRSRVKPADGFNFIAEEIQTDRQFFSGSPNVHDTAAPGELTGFKDSVDTLIASLHPGSQKGIGLCGLFSCQSLTSLEKVAARQCAC